MSEDPAEQRREQDAILLTIGCACLVAVVLLVGMLLWLASRGPG